MKFHNYFILLLQLLSTNINSANGERLKSQYVVKNTITISIFRSGGDFSFSSGTSLPGRRSTGADMYHHYGDKSQMGVHCFPWEYNPHQGC